MDRVLNPLTGRYIRVGGATYRRVFGDEVYRWLERECSTPLDPNRPRYYCGRAPVTPAGYAGRSDSYDCLRKGYKTGICAVWEKMQRGRR
jgi:hypothetical protein